MDCIFLRVPVRLHSEERYRKRTRNIMPRFPGLRLPIKINIKKRQLGDLLQTRLDKRTQKGSWIQHSPLQQGLSSLTAV